MVFDFEDLIEATEKGEVEEIEDIGSYVLECMLDIDEREFAKAVSKMSRREAQDFALLIAENEDFAEVLEEEDDEFNVLKQLINSLTGRSELEEALSQEVEDDKTLLWLFAEVSESAWNWLDDYVSEECGGRDTEDCPGGENIGAYCNALWESGFRTSDWEDFLSDTDLFAEEYESDVEDKNYEYEIADEHRSGYDGDFRDYCHLKAQLPLAVCDRTDEIKVEIVRRIRRINGKSDCAEITDEDLLTLDGMTINGERITALQVGDFDGLTNFELFRISRSRLAVIPANVFKGLTKLRSLELDRNRLTSLPSGAFTGLTALQILRLNNNQLTSLPEDVFDGLPLLHSVYLSGNPFSQEEIARLKGQLGRKLKDL